MVVEEGVASPEDVDGMWQIFTAAGIPPFRLMDRVGLDVVLNIEEHYAWVRPGLPEGPRKLLREYADVASTMSRAERRRTPRGTGDVGTAMAEWSEVRPGGPSIRHLASSPPKATGWRKGEEVLP